MTAKTLPLSKFAEALSQNGLVLVGCLAADDASHALSLQREHLSDWQQRGYGGEMQYMLRPPEHYTRLEHLLSGVRSILLVAAPYTRAAVPPLPAGCGRIARYAWGRDYHRALKKNLTRAVEQVIGNQAVNGTDYRIFTDAVPLLERALGAAAALGFIGRNSLLIHPSTGSYNFLAEALLKLDIEPDIAGAGFPGRADSSDKRAAPAAGCGSCRRCIPACPTNAIVGDGQVDSRRCISYLTIEKKTAFSKWESEAIGDWLFGCDICQEVCPFNSSPDGAALSAFDAEEGAGPFIELGSVFSLRTDEEFARRFAGTPLMRAGRLGLLRNAISVAVNTDWRCGALQLAQAARRSASPMILDHARAALEVFAGRSSGPERRRLQSAAQELEKTA